MVQNKLKKFTIQIQIAFILLQAILLPFYTFVILSLFHLKATKTTLAISIILVFSIFVFVFRSIWKRCTLIPALCSILMIVAAYFVSIHFYDVSYDGQVYHYLAVQTLSSGWNPIYGTGLKDVYRSNSQFLWVAHYAKGPWYFAAAMNLLFSHIEAGKIINILAVGVVFFLAWHVILLYQKKAGRIVPILIAGVLAVNPVVIGQLLTFYVDGVLASFLSILMLSLLLLYKRNEALSWFFTIGSLSFVLSIKFTAIGYVGVIGLFYLLFLLFKRDIANLKKTFVVFLLTGFIGVIILGFNPYVTNTVNNGHPFYPLAGKNPVDIISYTEPKNFKGENRFEKFYLSYTSKTQNIDAHNQTQSKNIMTFTNDEFEQMGTDTRINAFGPLFTLVGVGSILLAFLLFIKDKKSSYPVFFGIVAILSSVFINPEPWWARYTPQLWFLPVFILFVVIDRMKVGKWAGILLLLVLMFNSLKSDYIALDKARIGNNIMKAQLQAMKGKSIILNNSMFVAVPDRMKNSGITFTVQSKLRCKDPVRIYGTQAMYCEKK